MNLSSKLHDVIKRHEVAIVVLIALIATVYYLALLPGTQFGEPVDDAHYAMLIRNLATGKGFFDTSLPHKPIDTYVPPGYPALLTPIALLFPDQILPLQLVSLVFAIGCIFLTYAYLKLKKFSPTFTLLIVAFVAFNPVLAKYATIVMPETTFIFCFLLLLIALHHYERSIHAVNRSAIASILALAALFYLKTAASGLLGGVILYFVVIRKFRHAAVLTVGVGIFVGVLFLSRVAIGDPLIGYGYQANLSDYYLLDPSPTPLRMFSTIINGIWLYISFAISVTLMPPAFYIGNLSQSFYPTFDALYSWTIVPLVALGWFLYTRRYRDASVVAIPIYLASALVLPFINERRIILVLPIVIMYWFLGMKSLATDILPSIFKRWRHITTSAFAVMIGVLCVLLGVYIYTRLYTIYVVPIPKVDMSPQATWVKFLNEVPEPEDVSDGNNTYLLHYRTGHSYLAKLMQVCKPNDLRGFWQTLSQMKPRFILITGLTNSPARYAPEVDNCLLPALQQNPQNFVRVYSQANDRVQIYEVTSVEQGSSDREDLIDGLPLYTNNDRAIALTGSSSTETGLLVSFATPPSGLLVRKNVPLR